MDPKSAPDCCDGANASRTKDAGAGPLSRYVHYVQKRCQLTQHWHLTECSRHHPVAVVARLWIKLLAFTLFQAFAILHGKLYRLGKATFQELRKQIYRSLFCGRPFRLFSG